MTVAQAVFLLGAGAAAGIVGSAGGTASLISYPVARRRDERRRLCDRLAGLGVGIPA